MKNFREFVFYIENAKFTVLFDQATMNPPHVIPSPKYQRLHFHSYYELFYINSGTMFLYFKGIEHSFSKNNIVIIPPGVMHCSKSDNFGLGRYNLYFYMEKTSVKATTSFYDDLHAALSADYISLTECHNLRPLLENILLTLVQKNERILSLHFHQLMISLLNKLDSSVLQPAIDPITPDSDMIRLYKIQQMLYNTYHEDLKLNQVAEALFLSTRQTNRIIQQHYGCTFKDLVTRLRMQAAVDLLTNTNMSVLNIASRVGYSSTKGFYDHFKKYYQCLPTEYRRLHTRDT